ncbi:DUF2505 domain-containing protein [Rhodococcus sp. ARC_M6]|uniref:DUF2505 domain-containing protein n=1 Tax=Rhodococcus sp. ARC_M6 TaxID=2928852 RepID=UPI001FB2A46E|nr:DUF2505 domain-containing protein [Rhodococcus sp. ARC_M6]MCJ0904006.1 DUF2505 domain-containing protein [Rhodococcus sp. ARC_M6]
MSKGFRYDIEFSYPVAKVHSTLTDPSYWKVRLGELYPSAGIEVGDGSITVSVAEDLDSSALPGLVSKLAPDRLGVERVDQWGPLSGGRADGSVTGTAHGLPIRIEASLELAETAPSHAVLNVVGSAEVKIPVLGGQIEKLVKKMVEDLLHRDRDAVEAFLADQRDFDEHDSEQVD